MYNYDLPERHQSIECELIEIKDSNKKRKTVDQFTRITLKCKNQNYGLYDIIGGEYPKKTFNLAITEIDGEVIEVSVMSATGLWGRKMFKRQDLIDFFSNNNLVKYGHSII